jgi:hypothetical protein
MECTRRTDPVHGIPRRTYPTTTIWRDMDAFALAQLPEGIAPSVGEATLPPAGWEKAVRPIYFVSLKAIRKQRPFHHDDVAQCADAGQGDRVADGGHSDGIAG